MARTLQQLKESVERLIEQQGNDAPVAAFVFTNDDGEVADALVEEVTDLTQWCVVSLNYLHVLNTY